MSGPQSIFSLKTSCANKIKVNFFITNNLKCDFDFSTNYCFLINNFINKILKGYLIIFIVRFLKFCIPVGIIIFFYQSWAAKYFLMVSMVYIFEKVAHPYLMIDSI